MQPSLLAVLFLSHMVPGLLRGPYLQSVTSTSVVIRWRTDVGTDSRVSFGGSPGSLLQTVDSASLVTEHEVKLTSLQPGTKYYYSIGSSQAVLQGDADNFFQTAPSPGQAGKYRIGVFGDCGNNSPNQLAVRNRLTEYLGQDYMNAWLLLGDNAYSNGTDPEYQSVFFNMYKDRFLKQSPLYPCPGNHDYANNAVRQNDHAVPYYSIFTIPTAGEAGGVASGSKSFYSFDYGNIHFLSLDSYGKEDNSTRLYDTLGKQVQWIKADLAANSNKGWVVAYWHHPPYTKGSHDSDTEADLVKIRENFIRILERNGVDLILCGHSHDYERSKLLKGHYGVENTFVPGVYNLSESSGRYDGTPESCPYKKQSPENEGTVYVVAGSAGQLGATKAGYPHDALPVADSQHGGALLLQVEENRLDGQWIASDGIVRDRFTIMKDVNTKKKYEITKGHTVTLSASYVGGYVWNTAETTREVEVSPSQTTEYIVHDQQDCLADTMTVVVTDPLPVRLTSFSGFWGNEGVTLQWQTSEETNASHFVVERSQDGRHFEAVGKVAAVGESSVTRRYDYHDPQIAGRPGKVYYRLVEVDLDGLQQTSRIIAVQVAVPNDGPIRVQPNPSNGRDVKVEIAGGLGELELVLTDISGHILEKRKLISGNSARTISFGALKTGTYIITMIMGSNRVFKKFVVQ